MNGLEKSNSSNPNPHYVPAAALKRFAEDLVDESSTNHKFLQLNRDRISDFIEKPYTDPEFILDKPPKEKGRTQVAGICEYNFHSPETKSFIHLQKDPTFQPSLGARSRFGDGDGSFFDRWLNNDALTSSKVRDKKGLPTMKFALDNNRTGFKKMMEDYHNNKLGESSRQVSIIKPYAERKAERLKREKEKQEAEQQINNVPPPTLITQPSSPELRVAKQLDDRLKMSSIAALSSAERENYFGFEARSTFFSYYRDLSAEQQSADLPICLTSRSKTDDYLTVDINPSADTAGGMDTSRTDQTAMSSEIDASLPKFAAKTNMLVSPIEAISKLGLLSDDAPAVKPLTEVSASSPASSTGRARDRSLRVGSFFGRSQLDLLRETYSRMRQRDSAPSQEEKEALLNHLFAADPQDQRTTRPSSARTKYLMGCVQQNILPRPALIIRKEYSSFLNLSSLGMGNELAIILAEALDSVPLLEALSIADNALDDRGLVPIVRKLALCQSLKIFDLSQNKVDARTAEALRHFLTSNSCHLSVLKMSNANLDDDEAFRFMESIAVRNSLEEIDLSQNLLGDHELAIRRSHITAGEAIGRLLSTPGCSLTSLSLAWNRIRYHSGIALGEAIAVNQSLTFLDISYNSLAVQGGEALGIKSCESLHTVDLSGNPIGEEGARAVLALNISYGHRVKVDIKNSSVRLKDATAWFQPNQPIGDYLLDLSKPYDRAVCIELTRIVARDPELVITKFRWFDNESEAQTASDAEVGSAVTGGIEIRAEIASKATALDPTNELDSNMLHISTDTARDLFRETANRLFEQFDRDGSGSLDREELISILDQLGLDDSWAWVDKLLSIYDTDHSGRVEEDEFVGFLLDVKAMMENEISGSSSIKYIYDANQKPSTSTTSSTTAPLPYLPPNTGFMVMAVENRQQGSGISGPGNKFIQILSSKQVESLLNASKEVPDGSTLIELALSSNRWTINEAQAFFQAMLKENGTVLQVLLKVLPHMATPLDARMLIAYVTNHQFEQIQALKVLLGPLYRIFIGIPNAFYRLNLAEERDREALTRLTQLSLFCADKRKQAERGDTSQDGTFQSFRNTFYENKRVVMNEEWLSNLPDKGHLEFDFVALLEVSLQEKEISNFRLFRLLATLGMVDESKRMRMFSKINQNRSEGRAASKGTGSKRWEIGQNAAKEIAVQLEVFYDTLPSTRSSRAYHIDVGKEEASVLVGKRRLRKLAALAGGAGGGQIRLGNRRAMNNGSVMRRSIRRSTASSASSVDSMDSTTSTNTEASTPGGGGGGGTKPAPFQSVEEILNNQDKLFRIPENPVTTMDVYGHHIKEMLQNVTMERSLIAIRILDALETVLAGWLNVWNPLKPEGYIMLDLSRREERQVARMLITLNYVEPGPTWQEQSYRPAINDPPYDPEWKLPVSWYDENTLPKTGKGIQLQGCEPSIATRMSLMSLVLAQPYPEDIWHASDVMVNKAEKMVQNLGFRISFIADSQQQALVNNPSDFLNTAETATTTKA
eukprot:scaffold14461_cov250-Ochromonas_danica.AAC.9